MRLSGPNLLTVHQLCTVEIFDRLPELLKVLILHSDVVHCDNHGCVYIFNVGVPLQLLCLGVNVPRVRAGITRFGLPQLHQDLLAALQAPAGILDGFLMSNEIITEFLLFQGREDRAYVEHVPGEVHGIRAVLYLQLQGLLQVLQGRVILLLPTRLWQ